MRPIVEARLQRLLNQQAAHARAIDEEVAGDALAALHHHSVDETVRLALRHAGNLALGAHDAALLGEAAQEARVETRVEVERMRDVGHGRAGHVLARAHELGLPRRGGVDRVSLERAGLAELRHAQPEVMERQRLRGLPDEAEAVDVAVADRAPVDELDAKLERALRGTHELIFVYLQRAVEFADVRDRGLADADDADLVGFDEADAVLPVEHFRQRCGGHPAGGTATDNHDVARRFEGHGVMVSWRCVQRGRDHAACPSPD